MQNIIIQLLTEIQRRKQSENIIPDYPLLIELQAELKNRLFQELAVMEHNGSIKIGNTLNDKYIMIEWEQKTGAYQKKLPLEF